MGTPAPSLTAAPVRWARWWWVPVLVGLLVVAGWWATHPAALPTGSPRAVELRPGQEVYVGVLGPEPGRGTLDVRGVEVLGDPGVADVAAYVCRDGSVAETTAPDRFCAGVVHAEGAELRLGDGDTLLLRITARSEGAGRVEGVELAYREGLQQGTGRGGRPVSIEISGG